MLTPWDVQSKRVASEDGVSPTLQAGAGEGMTIQPVVLAFNEAQITSPRNGNNPQFGDPAIPFPRATGGAPTIVMTTANTNANGINVSDEGVSYTLDGANSNALLYCLQDTQGGAMVGEDVGGTLTSHSAKDAPVICVGGGDG